MRRVDESTAALWTTPSIAPLTQRFSRTMTLGVVAAGLAAVNGVLLWQASRFRTEAALLTAQIASVELARAQAMATATRDHQQLVVNVTRKQATNDLRLHLVVNADSSFVALVRGGVRLRVMKAEVGPSRRVGVPPDTVMVTRPQGVQAVARRIGSKDRYELPRWIWTDRSLPIPMERGGTGWLGDNAVVTEGGTILYTQPALGPLSDSSYVMPGALRLAPRDLAAIRESLAKGTRIYFY